MTLRLRTEARLKELFSRERMREQELIALKRFKEEVDETLSMKDQELRSMKERLNELVAQNQEMESSMQAMKNEVEIYKKQNRIYKHTIDSQMLPMQKL